MTFSAILKTRKYLLFFLQEYSRNNFKLSSEIIVNYFETTILTTSS